MKKSTYLSSMMIALLAISVASCSGAKADETAKKSEEPTPKNEPAEGAMNCMDGSAVFSFQYDNYIIDFSLVNTEIFWVYNESTQQNQLQVWMDNVALESETPEVYQIKIIFSGLTAEINPGSFSFDDAKHTAVIYLLDDENVIDTFDSHAFGNLTIDSYDSSTERVCGTFDVISSNGTLLIGQFSEVLSEF